MIDIKLDLLNIMEVWWGTNCGVTNISISVIDSMKIRNNQKYSWRALGQDHGNFLKEVPSSLDIMLEFDSFLHGLHYETFGLNNNELP